MLLRVWYEGFVLNASDSAGRGARGDGLGDARGEPSGEESESLRESLRVSVGAGPPAIAVAARSEGFDAEGGAPAKFLAAS